MRYWIFPAFSVIVIFFVVDSSNSTCAQSLAPPPQVSEQSDFNGDVPESFVGDRTVKRVKLLLRVKDVLWAGVEIGKVFEDFGGTLSSRGVSDREPNFFGEDGSKYSGINTSRSGNVEARIPLEKLDIVKKSVEAIATEVLYESVSTVGGDVSGLNIQKGTEGMKTQQSLVAEFSISLAQDAGKTEFQGSQSDIWKIFAILTGILLASLGGFAIARMLYNKKV